MSLSKVHFNEQGVILNAEKLDRKLVELEKLIWKTGKRAMFIEKFHIMDKNVY